MPGSFGAPWVGVAAASPSRPPEPFPESAGFGLLVLATESDTGTELFCQMPEAAHKIGVEIPFERYDEVR